MQRENEFLYRSLADILRSQINAGLIKPGSLLLSETEMCIKYNMSRSSVRKALNVLLEEALIIKMHGKGTMVSPNLTTRVDDSNTLVIVTSYPSNYANKGLPILMRIFQERYPEIKAKIFPVSFDEETYVNVMLKYGVTPDLFLLDESSFHQLKQNIFCHLDDFADRLVNIPPKIIEAFKRDGRLYAIPITYSPIYLAYNPELFATFGVDVPHSTWTSEQFLEAAKLLTRNSEFERSKESYGFSINSSFNRWYPFLLNRWSVQRGKQAIDSQSWDQNQFDWESFREVLQFIQDALYLHQISSLVTTHDIKSTQELFEKSQIAMIITTTLAFNLNPSQFGMVPIPFGSTQGNMLIANGLFITHFSKKKELAKLLLSLSLEPEVQREIALSTGFLAVSTDVNKEILQKSQFEMLELIDKRLENSKFIHELFPYMDHIKTLSDEMKGFWAGLESANVLVERLKTLNFFSERN